MFDIESNLYLERLFALKFYDWFYGGSLQKPSYHWLLKRHLRSRPNFVRRCLIPHTCDWYLQLVVLWIWKNLLQRYFQQNDQSLPICYAALKSCLCRKTQRFLHCGCQSDLYLSLQLLMIDLPDYLFCLESFKMVIWGTMVQHVVIDLQI